MMRLTNVPASSAVNDGPIFGPVSIGAGGVWRFGLVGFIGRGPQCGHWRSADRGWVRLRFKREVSKSEVIRDRRRCQ